MTVPSDPAGSAAWVHGGSRDGFESVTIERSSDGWTVFGATAAIEAGTAWNVLYRIDLDRHGISRRADIATSVGGDRRATRLEHDGAGRWHVDGARAPQLDGCLDVDLECSALTNAFPVRRFIPLETRMSESAPAAYVRVRSREVERLEQHYRRRSGDDQGFTFAYRAPRFEFSCDITYDAAGLVIDYPGIATRKG